MQHRSNRGLIALAAITLLSANLLSANDKRIKHTGWRDTVTLKGAGLQDYDGRYFRMMPPKEHPNLLWFAKNRTHIIIYYAGAWHIGSDISLIQTGESLYFSKSNRANTVPETGWQVSELGTAPAPKVTRGKGRTHN